MSGTDSDLDFESADEDAEFTKNIECETDAVVGHRKSPSLSKTQDEKCGGEANVEQVTSSVTSLSTEEPLPESESQIIKKDTSEQSNVSTNIDHSNKGTHTRKSAEVSNVEKSTAPKEKQRVPLRLEKKMHEKQQMSRENTTEREREKPSDLINILQENTEKQPSWGFGSWGSSLLSTAALSVSTFSSQVSQGIGTVLDTVESSLGAPSPEELAQTLNEKKKKDQELGEEVPEPDASTTGGLLPDVSSWTKVFENAGSKVVMGSLDTLELIGKKAMDVLTEGDPGLRIKRAAFSHGENLSQILREAKARADEQDLKDSNGADNIHYSQIFDEKRGLVHLEALEILSKQNQATLQRLSMRHSKNSAVKKQLEEIKSICENTPSEDFSETDGFDDFETVFKTHLLDLGFPLNGDHVIKIQKEIADKIRKYENTSEDAQLIPKEVFQTAIYSLAVFTAKCIETFHKAAEMILVQSNLDQFIENCATNLTGVATVMCIEVYSISSRFHKCLEASIEKSRDTCQDAEISNMATNLYVEAENSNKYIQDAYQMLIPILQVRLLEALE